jgi:hypothetical protein
MVSEAMLRLVQTVDLSCTETHYLQMDQNEILHDTRHLAVPSGASKMISALTVRSAQTVHLSWIKISTISKRTKTSLHLSLVA